MSSPPEPAVLYCDTLYYILPYKGRRVRAALMFLCNDKTRRELTA